MNILFLTLAKVNSINDKSIYQDLLRKFHKEGHSIYVVTPTERRFGNSTALVKEKNISILKVWTFNIQKTNIFEKGIGTILLEFFFKRAINKFFKNKKFDLILYSTPPITFTRLITYLINKNKSAKTYLLLKDIFPQNAVDLKMINPTGLLYHYFRNKEIELYKMSNWIGCMSEANKKYLLKHNSYLDEEKVEVNPNSICLKDFRASLKISNKFSNIIPKDKIIFLYGGNLGKPQGIDFLLDVIIESINIRNAFFIVVGSGTETKKIDKWFKQIKPINAIFIDELDQTNYENLLHNCHVGLVFLHPDFTIPNYPSRILTYMKHKLPILFATDLNTDVGKEAETYEYGLWCKSGDLKQFRIYIELLTNDNDLRNKMGVNGFERLNKDFSVDHSYNLIMNHFCI